MPSTNVAARRAALSSARVARAIHPLTLASSLALAAHGLHAATITVTDGGDVGTASTCTLRQAIDSARNDAAGSSSCVAGSGGDTIAFGAALKNSTISLAGGQLVLDGAIDIAGSGQTIDALAASRVMYIAYGANVGLSNLTLTNGDAGGIGGGGISIGGLLSEGSTPPSQDTATVVLDHVRITNSHDIHWVAGLFAHRSDLTLVHSEISGNTLAMDRADAAQAGGLYAVNSQVTIVDSTISGNSATTPGIPRVAGGVYLYQSGATLANSTLSGNSVTSIASGFYQSGGLSVRSPSATVTLTNTTISGNQSAAAIIQAGCAGGLLLFTGTANLANTILSGNSGGSGDVYQSLDPGRTLTASYSVLGTAVVPASGSHNVATDAPKLGALANNGGATQTMAPAGDSPALDVGSPALAQAGVDALNYDQRGFGYPRTLDGKVDIGAFQHQGDRIFASALEGEP